jgi:uncharacterized protein (DUF2141 family)
MLLVLFAALLAASPPAAPAPGSVTLESGDAAVVVNVANVRDGKGQIICVLFNGPAGFPGASPLKNGEVKVKAPSLAGDGKSRKGTPRAVGCTFDRLPPGDYAVLVYHDENGNGLFDRDAVGIPTEGYGVSNNALPALSAPTFAGARFHLGAGERHGCSVSLRY